MRAENRQRLGGLALQVQHSGEIGKQLRIDLRIFGDPDGAINLERDAREFLGLRVSPLLNQHVGQSHDEARG